MLAENSHRSARPSHPRHPQQSTKPTHRTAQQEPKPKSSRLAEFRRSRCWSIPLPLSSSLEAPQPLRAVVGVVRRPCRKKSFPSQSSLGSVNFSTVTATNKPGETITDSSQVSTPSHTNDVRPSSSTMMRPRRMRIHQRYSPPRTLPSFVSVPRPHATRKKWLMRTEEGGDSRMLVKKKKNISSEPGAVAARATMAST